MRVTIFDYGAGNLHSIAKALADTGASVATEDDPSRAVQTDFLVLPGVGGFETVARRLAPGIDRMRAAIASGLPTLGICLGMQVLFEGSDEGAGEGLGVFAGRVTRLRATRSPQIGWNAIEKAGDDGLARASLDVAYYANSFACRPTNPSIVTAWSTHEGDRFPAVVRRGAVVGVQFHPEKSSLAGVQFLAVTLSEVKGISLPGSNPFASLRVTK